MMECHKCPFNGKKSAECLKCYGGETYEYKYTKYILDEYEPPSHDTSGSE